MIVRWLKSLLGGARGNTDTRRDPLNPDQETYSYPTTPQRLSKGRRDELLVVAILEHVERHLGPARVFSTRGDTLPIDLVVAGPTDDHPCWTVVTAGMSARPMHPPSELRDEQFAELMIRLPREWPMPDVETGDLSAWNDPAAYWPMDFLRRTALFPHVYRTWFGFGQSMGSEDQRQPIAPGVAFTGCAFLYPITVGIEGFERISAPGKDVTLLSVLPLYPDELEYKRLHGFDGLVSLAGDRILDLEIIDPNRPSILGPVASAEEAEAP